MPELLGDFVALDPGIANAFEVGVTHVGINLDRGYRPYGIAYVIVLPRIKIGKCCGGKQKYRAENDSFCVFHSCSLAVFWAQVPRLTADFRCMHPTVQAALATRSDLALSGNIRQCVI